MGNIKKRKKNNRNNKRNKQKKKESVISGTPPNEEPEDLEESSDPTHGQTDNPQNESKSLKRDYSEDYSDQEEKPKRKKKKKQTPSEGNEQGKGKKSIRQMKREKFAQRQSETEATAKDALKKQCLSYLSQWKHARQQWKFMKAKQVWLYKNKFSSKLLPDDSWPLLLEYFESAKGNIRNMLLEDAKKVIQQMDECVEKESTTENKDEEVDEENESAEPATIAKPDETSYKRARDLLQHLEE